MHSVLTDLKLVSRQLRRTPGFVLTAVLMLAFGIGSATFIFSIVNGVLLNPLPFPHADRLVTLGDQVNGTDWGKQDAGPVTGPEVLTYQRDTRSFEGLGGFGSSTFELSGNGSPVQINASRMTPSVFATLAVAPCMGRVFTQREDEQKEQVAVLSYATWKGRFSGDWQILGKKLLLDRKPYVVVGVMPRGFEFPLTGGLANRAELWVPMSFSAQELSHDADANWFLNMVGRLKRGVTPAQAQSDTEVVAQQIMRKFSPALASFRFKPVIYPLQQITVLQARPLLRLLFLAVVVLLVLACANLSGLLLVRAINRQREAAVRLALGAPTRRLFQQMILEALLLSTTGGVLGIGLAAFALHLGKTFLPETLPLIDRIRLDPSVAGFALLLALFTGIVCGLTPAFAVLRINVNASLKEGGRSGSKGGNYARLRSALTVLQIGIALTLVTSAGLLIRSLKEVNAVDLGFRPDHVTTAAYSLPRQQYSRQGQINTFNSRLLQQIRQLPGVQSVGLTSTLPTTGNGIQSFVVEGYNDPRGAGIAAASPSQVIGDYFQAIGTPLLRGRLFKESDTETSQLVVIVNHELAERYWPHQDPIGKRMHLGTEKMNAPWMSVIGEVGDAKLNSPDADAAEQFYQPTGQVGKDAGADASSTDLNGNYGYIVLRSAIQPEQIANALRATVHFLDPQLPLTAVQPMEQVVSRSEAPRRFDTIMISSFALAATSLAALGIYSIIAFSIASRIQEMAIRMALGSSRSEITTLILKSGLKLASVGCALGLMGATAASNILGSFLFHVSPFDPLVLLLASSAVFLLALAASASPAYRAAMVDPVQALRGD